MEEFTQQHISQQFNAELNELRNQVLTMGGLVEEQLEGALQSMANRDRALAEKIYANDYRINTLEVSIDDTAVRILARRQPAASDLRFVMAVIKTITDLERIADQSKRIARMAMHKSLEDANLKHHSTIAHLSAHVQTIVHQTLDAFARMDIKVALEIIHGDSKVDNEYENISRQLITYMMEDPRVIPIALSLLWSARSLERIADHSRNVCEYVIYFVKGKDIRHTSLEHIDKEAGE